MRRALSVIGAALLACGPATAQQINLLAYRDNIAITDSKPLIGPAGMKTSCILIAQQLGSIEVTVAGGVLYDNLGRPWSEYESSQSLFGVPFVNWTPNTVSFLKTTIDQCAQESTLGKRLLRSLTGHNGGVIMSPQLAKDVVDRIYATAAATNEQAKRQYLSQYIANLKSFQQNAEQQQTLMRHLADLKAGKAQIESIDDAMEVYGPAKNIDLIIASPLLTPDDDYYGGSVTLDALQQDSVLRAKITNYVDPLSNPPRFLNVAYVFLKYKDAKILDPSVMRLERRVRVIGRYVQNIQYDTVSGETETSPVLDVLYIGQ